MFELTKEQELLVKMTRDYATNELEPRAEDCDKLGFIPEETYKEMGQIGLLGLNVPKEYGGAGMDDICKVLSIIEVGKKCGSTAEMFAVQTLVNFIINKNGNEEQKQHYLPMYKEGKIGAFGLTEPDAGSDAGSLQTTADQDGTDYILNGAKVFISNMGPNEGEYAIVFALTDKAKGSHGGVTAFLIDRGTPGFELGKLEDKMGIRGAAVSELVFQDCRVPKEAVLGKVGKGMHVAFSGLDSGRVGIASQSIGYATGALDLALEYSKQRQQFGRPISANQGLQWYLAEMAVETDAARLMALRAASMMSKGINATKEASMAKFYASEIANKVVAKALQIHGGYGYIKDYAIERIYRDARIVTIYEGSSEVQKIVISRALLG
jgi:alkylation response protein AidB-like acyl-CoA dehydrogenase